MKTNDLLWKGIIEELCDDFLLYFYPDDFDTFDIERGIEFLDKELEQLFPTSKEKPRHVDKLLKIYLKNGSERWILVHVEVQGNPDPLFDKRIYIYNYRIFDRYDQMVSSVAIFTDSNKKYHPKEYKSSFLGTEISFKFKTYKVLEQDLKILRASNNPFATVIETAYLALKKGKIDDDSLYDLKIDLVRRMFKKNFSKNKIRAMLGFIKFYVRFENPEKGLNFDFDIDKITNKTYPMTVEEILLWQAKEEGIEQGIEQGIGRGD